MPSTLRAVPRPQGEHSTTASSSYRAGHRCCRCRRTLLRRPSSPCGHWPRRCGSPRDARPGRSRRFQRKIRGAGTGRGRTSPPSDPWRSPDRSVSVTPAAPRDRRESPGCGHAVALVAVLRCITAARRRPRFTGGGPLSVPLAALPGGERPVGEPSRSAVKGGGHKGPREPPRDHVAALGSPPPHPPWGQRSNLHRATVPGSSLMSPPSGIRRSAFSGPATYPWAHLAGTKQRLIPVRSSREPLDAGLRTRTPADRPRRPGADRCCWYLSVSAADVSRCERLIMAARSLQRCGCRGVPRKQIRPVVQTGRPAWTASSARHGLRGGNPAHRHARTNR